MHRVLGSKDLVVLQVENHPPAAGGSIGLPNSEGVCNAPGKAGFWKLSSKIEMGPSKVHPVGLGHDGGPGRIHVLVTYVPEPFTSAALSVLCTTLSSVKAHFTAHKVQINVDGSALPICCQALPDRDCCNLSLLFCSLPSLPNLTCPIIPSQDSVWVGMTNGDIAGAVVNILADMAFDIAMFGFGGELSSLGKIGKAIADVILPAAMRITGANGVNTGPSNLGGPVQQWIDGDGLTSDAGSSITVFGIGIGIEGNESVSDTSFTYPKPSTPWSS